MTEIQLTEAQLQLYAGALIVTGLVVLAVTVIAGTAQGPLVRALSRVVGVGFAGYGAYLLLFHSGGGVAFFPIAFVLPVLMIVNAVRARRAQQSQPQDGHVPAPAAPAAQTAADTTGESGRPLRVGEQPARLTPAVCGAVPARLVPRVCGGRSDPGGSGPYGHRHRRRAGPSGDFSGAAAARAASTRAAWVGGSGTPGARRAANSRRSTGTTRSPSRSICSSTVFSGSPAWSMRNSCRW